MVHSRSLAVAGVRARAPLEIAIRRGHHARLADLVCALLLMAARV